MTMALRDSFAEAVLELLDRLEKIADPFSPEFDELDLGDWPQIHVYIPHPEVSSSITPPFMEAFLRTAEANLSVGCAGLCGSG